MKPITIERWLLVLILAMQVVITWGIFRGRSEGDGRQVVAGAAGAGVQSPATVTADSIDRWRGNPFHTMDAMLDSAFQDIVRMNTAMRLDSSWDRLKLTPTMDMRSDKGGYLVSVSIPGISATNVNVALDGRVLRVSAMSRTSNGYTSGWQQFDRRILLPGAIGNPDDMRAGITNGLLRIFIPKGTRLDQPRIKIRVY